MCRDTNGFELFAIAFRSPKPIVTAVDAAGGVGRFTTIQASEVKILLALDDFQARTSFNFVEDVGSTNSSSGDTIRSPRLVVPSKVWIYM